MKIQSMRACHKVRKMTSLSARHTESWKYKKLPAAYQKNLATLDSPITPAEFQAQLEYMNEWLNHPLFPQFI